MTVDFNAQSFEIKNKYSCLNIFYLLEVRFDILHCRRAPKSSAVLQNLTNTTGRDVVVVVEEEERESNQTGTRGLQVI
jgi:hypothetical protein